MRFTEADIERIVQEVLRRLAAMNVLPQNTAVTTLTIASRLITLTELTGKLQGITRVDVQLRAVVTPAAKDYMRERGVQLVRKP